MCWSYKLWTLQECLVECYRDSFSPLLLSILAPSTPLQWGLIPTHLTIHPHLEYLPCLGKHTHWWKRHLYLDNHPGCVTCIFVQTLKTFLMIHLLHLADLKVNQTYITNYVLQKESKIQNQRSYIYPFRLDAGSNTSMEIYVNFGLYRYDQDEVNVTQL